MTPKYIVMRSDGKPIPEDEPVFVIRAQDMLAVPAIRAYATMAEDACIPWSFIDDINQHLHRVKEWQNNNVKVKWPD